MSDRQRQELQFSADEVGELIDLAVRLDDPAIANGLSYEELVHVAGEVGISKEAIERAVATDRAESRRQAKQAKKRVRRRMRFVRHAVVYAVVVSSLLLIDALNGGGWWFYYVAALWGAALALQGMKFLTRRSGPIEQAMIGRESTALSIDS